MEYRNEDLIIKYDIIADKIISLHKNNSLRDRFFPLMIDSLGFKTGIEIGSDKGEFAEHLLSKSKLEKLYCVDPWIDDFGSDHREGYYDKNGDVRFNQCATTLNKYLAQNRCELIRAKSVEAYQDNDLPELFDFCYVDGDHSLDGIYNDIHLWTHRVRVGGIIAGHDYKDGKNSGMSDYFGNQLPYMVKSVVDNYCLQYGYKLNIVGGVLKSWWFVKV